MRCTKSGRAWTRKLLGLGLTLGLLGAVPAEAQPYHNPVVPFAEAEIADPFILEHRGEYYMYASGDPIVAFHSRDLVNWTKLGPVLTSTPGGWNETDVWAPEVIYRNGKFLMYYTASRKGADWRVGEMSRRVGVAVSNSPAGPFVDSGKPVTPTWAIDGHVYTDKSGQDWLFYSFLQEPQHPGAGIAVDRLVAYNKVAGQPTVCLQGTEAWEDKDGDPNNGSLRYTNEGPTVIERDGTLYLFYSGGSWDRPTYAVGYATATAPQGPWKKVAPPVMRATPLVDGPGHNALAKAPNGFDDVHFYHARTQPYLDPWNRAPFADRLTWAGERPAVSQPTLALQPAPEKPDFADLFDSEGEPGAGWEAVSGSFTVQDGALHGSGSRAELKLAQEPDGPYLLKLSLRLINDSRAGLKVDGDEVVLDAQNRVLRTSKKVLYGFPKEFATDAFHQLAVASNSGRTEVWLDGVRRGSLEASEASPPSLFIESGEADFDGVSLASVFHESLRAAAEPAGWEGQGGTFAAAPDGWLQSGQGTVWRTKGPYRSRYEFSATVLPRDTSAPQVAKAGPTDNTWRAGIVAARAEGGELLLAGYDKGIWPYGRFRVWESRDGQPGDPIEVGLPRGFRYDVPHTVTVRRDRDRFSFFLDDAEILAARFDFPDSQAGLLTQNVVAAFSDASYKALVSAQNLLLNAGFESEQWDGEKDAHANPWRLSGKVRPNESSAHSGVRRLLFRTGQGRAEQTVRLEGGRYRLHAFASGRDAQLGLSIGKMSLSHLVESDGWTRFTSEFEISASDSVPVALSGTVPEGGHLAVDDVWLEKL